MLFTMFLKRWLDVLRSFNFFPHFRMGYCGKNVYVSPLCRIYKISNLYMYDNTNIYAGSKILCTRAKFIMKKNSGAATGLNVVTGGHLSLVGRWFKEITDKDKDSISGGNFFDKDIIVEEDVWIASNVTLLSGVRVGRGAVVGSGSVCRNKIPPYAVVVGNPAKIVGFKFTPEEIIKHEKELYPEEERLLLDMLIKNYDKLFIGRIEEIRLLLKS